ncbi:ABC transporter permease [Symbiobacterium thermophilum]
MVRPSGLAWRSLRHSPRRVALTVAGAALGVGLTVAVLCLASMARAGVEARIQEEFGGIDLVVGSMDGRTWFGPEDLAEIEAIAGVRDVGVAYFPFAGDPFETDQAIRYVGLSPHPGTLQLFKLPRPVGDDEVFVSDQMAADMGISAGQTVTLPFPDQPRTFRVGEIVSPPLRAGTPKLAYFSLRTMQDVAGQPGAITAFYIRLIDPRLKLQTADDIQEALERRHPGVARDLTVDMAFEADEARRTAGGLRSLGLLTGSLTLLVSALLVVGVTQFTLRERLQEIALLRAVGATLKQARGALLVEVLLLGGLGALTGTAAGIVLAPAVGRILSPALGVPLVTALPSIGELLPAVLLGWGLGCCLDSGAARDAGAACPGGPADRGGRGDGAFPVVGAPRRAAGRPALPGPWRRGSRGKKRGTAAVPGAPQRPLWGGGLFQPGVARSAAGDAGYAAAPGGTGPCVAPCPAERREPAASGPVDHGDHRERSGRRRRGVHPGSHV